MPTATVTKTCTKCKTEKLVEEFYCRNGKPIAACKDCTKRQISAYQSTDAAKAYEKTRRNTEERRAYQRNASAKYRTEHPDLCRMRITRWQKSPEGKAKMAEKRKRNRRQIKARHAVSNAIRDGRLIAPIELICIRCGAKATVYHHPSYEPEFHLVVLPLCIPCHIKEHTAKTQTITQ
jgi:hypothetical protein